MRAYVISVDKEALNAVGGNACRAEEPAIGRAGDHHRKNGYARPERVSDAAGNAHEIGIYRRRRAARNFLGNFHFHLIIGEDLLEGALNILDRIFRKHAAVHVCCCELREGVPSVTRFKLGSNAGGSQHGIPHRRGISDALHGLGRALCDLQEVFVNRSGLNFCHLLEVGSGHIVRL